MIHEKAVVTENRRLAEGVFSTVFRTETARISKAGQFVMVGTGSDSRLLKRPISISGADPLSGELRLVYRTVGYGTTELSLSKEGDAFDILGPAGNGFPVEKASGKKNILLVAGGIGAPPLLYLLRELKKTGAEGDCITAVLGYRGEKYGLFLKDEFEKEAKVIISSDDGSVGVQGTVMDAIREKVTEADLIFACGPLGMLKAVKGYASEKGIPAYISLEEKMACGVGACLGCVVKTAAEDPHSHVNNARICTEGPVFEASEVMI